jgi:signal peptidase II
MNDEMTEPVTGSRWVLFWSIALGGAAFDLVTKAAAFARIGEPPAAPVPLIPDILELHTSYNSGALWGFGRGLPHSSLIFAALSVVAAVVICYWLFVRGAARDGRLTAALGLIMAGALGNCYDRLVLGHVRDFVHFHVDPIGFDCAIFNFADNMLVAGAVALMLLALRPEPASTTHPIAVDVPPASAESAHSA